MKWNKKNETGPEDQEIRKRCESQLLHSHCLCVRFVELSNCSFLEADAPPKVLNATKLRSFFSAKLAENVDDKFLRETRTTYCAIYP